MALSLPSSEFDSPYARQFMNMKMWLLKSALAGLALAATILAIFRVLNV